MPVSARRSQPANEERFSRSKFMIFIYGLRMVKILDIIGFAASLSIFQTTLKPRIWSVLNP